MMNLKTIMLLLSISPIFLYGQTIKGKVTDRNNKPLGGVSVKLKSTDDHNHASEDGTFVLNCQTCPDTLIVEHFTYKTQVIPISSNQIDSLFINLEKVVFELSEVVIDKSIKSVSMTTEVDLQTNPVTSSQELLRTVPGIIIGQHAGGGKAEQIFLRGFDIDHGTDVAITVDGMPVNMVSHAHGQGYSDMHFIIPETVDEIEFGKGSYYADKGNFATAGYVGFETKDRLKTNMVSMELGQFNTQRILSMTNLFDNNDQSAYAALDYNASDGWFESNQNFKRLNLFGKYTGYGENGTKTTLSISHFFSRWDASGQIPVRAIDRGIITRFGAIDDTEGGNTSRTNVVLNTTHFLNDNTVLKNTVFYTHYDFQLFSNFTFFARDAVNGDQIMQRENRNLMGGESQLKRTYSFDGFKLRLAGALGMRYDFVNDNELSYTANRRTTLENVQLGDVQETNTYAYLNADFDFGKWLINPSVRFDHFNFNYTSALDSTYTSPVRTGGIVSPKLNIIYQPSSKIQTYLKNGIGFHSNDSRVVVQQNVEQTLPKAYSSDLGVILKPTPRLLINAAVWQLFLEQEFVYVGDEGIVEPSGRTQRFGVDLGFRYEVIKGLFAFSDFTYAHARSIDDPEGENYIPLAPVFTNTGGLSYSSESPLSASIRYRFISERPANEDYSITAEGYFVTDFNVNYDWNNWRFGIIIQNLFNTDWRETQFATTSQLASEATPVEEIHFTPGIPFALRGKVSYIF